MELSVLEADKNAEDAAEQAGRRLAGAFGFHRLRLRGAAGRSQGCGSRGAQTTNNEARLTRAPLCLDPG